MGSALVRWFEDEGIGCGCDLGMANACGWDGPLKSIKLSFCGCWFLGGAFMAGAEAGAWDCWADTGALVGAGAGVSLADAGVSFDGAGAAALLLCCWDVFC